MPHKLFLLASLTVSLGCARLPHVGPASPRLVNPSPATASQTTAIPAIPVPVVPSPVVPDLARPSATTCEPTATAASPPRAEAQIADDRSSRAAAAALPATAAARSDLAEPVQPAAASQPLDPPAFHSPAVATAGSTAGSHAPESAEALGSLPTGSVQLNLPTALAMVGGQHPAVGSARWRVQEAYAQLDQARLLWLPSLQAGFSFHRHDGNYQGSNGQIVDINRNSFQYGLGAGSVGAGTTPRPGIVAEFHLADAIFLPEFAEKTAWARGHASQAVLNQQLLLAATSYVDLLAAHQLQQVLEQSQQRIGDVARLTGDFAETGQGLQADADRLQTELMLVESRLAAGRGQVAIAAARLVQALSLPAGSQPVPMDAALVPLEYASGSELGSLIATGLATRPELKESQALVVAACEQFQRQKYAPFVPSLLLGFSTGGFGGGLGSDLSNIDDRYDLDALMTWQVRNLGYGEAAFRREAAARVQQARFEKLRVLDQVAREISEAHAQIEFRRQQMELSSQAIQFALDSFERNLARIRDGQGLPLEVLQSVQALEAARVAYVQALVEFNRAQFQLQWAIGWPLT